MTIFLAERSSLTPLTMLIKL